MRRFFVPCDNERRACSLWLAWRNNSFCIFLSFQEKEYSCLLCLIRAYRRNKEIFEFSTKNDMNKVKYYQLFSHRSKTGLFWIVSGGESYEILHLNKDETKIYFWGCVI